MEEVFNLKLSELKVSVNSVSIKTEELYNKIIDEVLNAKNRKVKTAIDYRRLKRYDVLKVGETNKLILPMCKSENNKVKYYVYNSELFEIIKNAHIETGHGGIHKLELNLKEKYVNITREIIKIFLSTCQSCLKKRVHPKKGIEVNPMDSKEVYVPAQSTSNANPPVEFVAVEDFAANINGKEVGASPKRNTANASMVVGQPSSSQMNRGIKRKVVTTTTKQTVNTSNEDEFDLFCKSLACQLRNMPLNRALICQEKLQSIMTQERLSQMGINYEQQAEPTEYEVIVKQETDVDAKSEY